jgi:tRNA(fMet)-specific endonuclease VapC
MLQFLFDTDHLTLYHHQHPLLMQRIAARHAGAVGISPISVEETLRGRLAPLARGLTGITHVQAYARLVAAVEMLTLFPLVPFDIPGESQFQQLRAARLRVGTQDLKIAAIALTNNLTVLTRNRRDFGRIPGLTLADWSV